MPARCYACGRVPAQPQQCADCRTAVYCDAACQAYAWSHRDHAAWCAHYRRATRGVDIGGKRAREPAPGDDKLDEARRTSRMRRTAPPPAPARPLVAVPTTELDGLPTELLMAILENAPRAELTKSVPRTSERLRAVAGRILLDRDLAKAGPNAAAAFAERIKPAHPDDPMAQYLSLLQYAARELAQAFVGLTLHFFMTEPAQFGNIRQDQVTLMRRAPSETLLRFAIVDPLDFSVHTENDSAKTDDYEFAVLPVLESGFDNRGRPLRVTREFRRLAAMLSPEALLGASLADGATTAYLQMLAAYVPEGVAPDLREWQARSREPISTLGYESMLVHTCAVSIYPLLYQQGADAVYVEAVPDRDREPLYFEESFEWFEDVVIARAHPNSRALMGLPRGDAQDQPAPSDDPSDVDSEEESPEIAAVRLSWGSDLLYSVTAREQD